MLQVLWVSRWRPPCWRRKPGRWSLLRPHSLAASQVISGTSFVIVLQIVRSLTPRRSGGLDENEHIARGIRRAQLAATRETLQLWNRVRPYDAADTDRSRELASLLDGWCDKQGQDSCVSEWVKASRNADRADQVAALLGSFEAAFGAEVAAGSDGVVQRAAQARELASQAAFDDAVESALAATKLDRAEAIRASAGFQSFRARFFQQSGGGWFDLFLHAIGQEFKANAEFKRLWDSVQLASITAMLLDQRELSVAQRDELKGLIQCFGDQLGATLERIEDNTEKLLSGQESLRSESAAWFEKLSRDIARDKGVEEAPLREVLRKLGEADVPVSEIPDRLHKAADELIQLREDLARLRNDRPEFAAIRARASALIDKGEFDAARSELRKGREAARALREEFSRSEAGFLLDEARIERLQLNYDGACANFAEAFRLDPDNCWISLELGLLWMTRGSLAKAAEAFAAAVEAARHSGDERAVLVCQGTSGDVQIAQGHLSEALRSFRAALTISERLLLVDPGHAGWQRDLSVSHGKLGMLYIFMQQFDEARVALGTGRAIIDPLVMAHPEFAQWKRDLASFDNLLTQLAQET